MSGHIWSCKIGEGASIPDGADLPMRRAVQDAYFKLTGSEPVFCFSGWGAKLSEGERAVVENREPRPELTDEARIRAEERAKTLEDVVRLVLGGHFLHDQAPTAKFAREVAEAIRRELGAQSGGKFATGGPYFEPKCRRCWAKGFDPCRCPEVKP